MNVLERFDRLCLENESDVNVGLNDAAKLISVYAFYHYFNGDETQLDEIQNSLCYSDPEEWFLTAVFRSTTIDGNAVDFLTTVNPSTLKNGTEKEIKNFIQKEALSIGKVVLHDGTAKVKVRLVYDQLGVQMVDDETAYCTLRILCNWVPEPEEKIRLQTIVSSCGVKSNKVGFELLFADDIEQEIDDIESPKEYVSNGVLNVFESSPSCQIGPEGSFLTVISAQSLKMLFFQYSTRGLFASNLRFFISAKKIDPKIIDSIKNDSGNFVYYNNGIIITCDSCVRVGDQLRLTNFSIVNGGQTTNLIGRTPFEADFGVVCKVIVSKYDDRVEKVEFLAKVAEASNMQKPINAKDLIANKKEQRLLKEQYFRCGIFLKVKRGEKINKSLFPEPWQNASNDEVAQILYSTVYQMPGAAKNGRSTILSNDKVYDLIFKSEYSDDFVVSLQHLKVAFAKWKKDLLKKEARSSEKVGLARTGDLLAYASVALIVKTETNESLLETLLGILPENINSENEDLKFLISQNDIGKVSLIRKSLIPYLKKETLNPVFDFVFDNILVPAYRKFKRDYPNYAYVNFNKVQSYYGKYVLPVAIDLIIKKGKTIESTLGDILNLEQDSSKGFSVKRVFGDYKPGLKEELEEYKKRKIDQSNGHLNATTGVFRRMQLQKICLYLPKTVFDLEYKCGMGKAQIEAYGPDIIKIVSKYCDISQFEEGGGADDQD